MSEPIMGEPDSICYDPRCKITEHRHAAGSGVPEAARAAAMDRAIDAAVEAWLGDEWVSTLGPEERLLGVHALYPAVAAAVAEERATTGRRIEALADTWENDADSDERLTSSAASNLRYCADALRALARVPAGSFCDEITGCAYRGECWADATGAPEYCRRSGGVRPGIDHPYVESPYGECGQCGNHRDSHPAVLRAALTKEKP